MTHIIYVGMTDEKTIMSLRQSISLKNTEYNTKNVEYSVNFCMVAHGTGATRFAAKKILKYGFEVLGLERIYLM